MLWAVLTLVFTPLVSVTPAVAKDLSSCNRGIWVNLGNLQINNFCSEPITIMLHSTGGQCTNYCVHTLAAHTGYHIYTISGDVNWWACPAYQTPRVRGGRVNCV